MQKYAIRIFVSWQNQRRSNIRTGSAAHFCIIGFLVNFLCIVAPPAAPRSGRVKFVFFNRASYVGLTSRQHLATVIRYADHIKQHFRLSRRHHAANFTIFITRLLRLWQNFRLFRRYVSSVMYGQTLTIMGRSSKSGSTKLIDEYRPTL